MIIIANEKVNVYPKMKVYPAIQINTCKLDLKYFLNLIIHLLYMYNFTGAYSMF